MNMLDGSMLTQAEFTLLHFDLRLTEEIDIDMALLLRLRRSLRAAASYLFAATARPRFNALFAPPLASDPVARRQFQKGAPAFVFHHQHLTPGRRRRGERFTLSAVVFGGDAERVRDLARVVQALGDIGLHQNRGRFALVAVRGEDSAGNDTLLWRSGQSWDEMMPVVRDCGWWLGNRPAVAGDVRLSFVTPARLVHQGRPLFRSTVHAVVPFILRRVTSMLYTHCYVDLSAAAVSARAAVARLRQGDNSLHWHDWRQLHGDETQPLGGLVGSVVICGAALEELLPWLHLGSLMNIGKNAAWGAGCYRID